MAKYYQLCIRINDAWSPEFGDFDLECVKDERQDYADSDYKAKDLVIITCKDSSRAALIEAYERKFKTPFPCKTPKEKWKASHREFRTRLALLPTKERWNVSTCTFRVNGRAIEYTVTALTFSIQTEPETMRDGLFSRSELHANLNAVRAMNFTSRETVAEMRKLNKRSFRLGFKLP